MSKKRRAAVTVATLLVFAALWGGGDSFWPCPAWGQDQEEDDVLLAQQGGPAAGEAPAKAGGPTKKRLGIFIGGPRPDLSDQVAEIVLAAATAAMESEAVGPELLRGKLKLDARQLETCLASDDCLQSVADDHDLFGIVLGWLQPGKRGEDCSLKLTLYVPGEGKGRFLPLTASTCNDLLTKVVRAKVATLFAARKKALAKAGAPVPPPAEAKASFEDVFGQCKHKAGLAAKKQIPLAAALEPCEQALGLLATAKDDKARAAAQFFVAQRVYYPLSVSKSLAARVFHFDLAVTTAKQARELNVAGKGDAEFTAEIDQFMAAITAVYVPIELRPGRGWAELRPEYQIVDMEVVRAPIAPAKKLALGLLKEQFKRGVTLPVTVWLPFGRSAKRDAMGQILTEAEVLVTLNGVAFEVVSPEERQGAAGIIYVPALANVESFLKPPRLMAMEASLFGSPGVVGGYAGFGLGLVPGLTLRFEAEGAKVGSTNDALLPLSGEAGLGALLEWCPSGMARSADFGLCFDVGAGGAWVFADEAGGMAGTAKLSAALKLPAGFVVELGGRGMFGGMGYVYPALGMRWQYLFWGTPPAFQEEEKKTPVVAEKAAGEGKEKAGGEPKGAAKEVAP